MNKQLIKKEFYFLFTLFYFYLGLDGIHIEIEPLEKILDKRNCKMRWNITLSSLMVKIEDDVRRVN